MAAELRRLAELRDRGVLTQSEYEAQQAKVLGRPPAGTPAHAASAAATPESQRLSSSHLPPSDPPAPGQPGRRRRMAERSDFTALLALLCALVFWPAGLVLGYQARREARRSGEDGGLALAALIVAYVAGVVTVLVVILAL
jgi:hypothetical protein